MYLIEFSITEESEVSLEIVREDYPAFVLAKITWETYGDLPRVFESPYINIMDITDPEDVWQVQQFAQDGLLDIADILWNTNNHNPVQAARAIAEAVGGSLGRSVLDLSNANIHSAANWTFTPYQEDTLNAFEQGIYTRPWLTEVYEDLFR